MNINWWLVPTLILSIGLFFFSKYLWSNTSNTRLKTVLIATSLLFAIPGVLFVVYYFHWFDNATWFYQMRSLNYIELSAAGAGPLAGIISAALQKRKVVSTSFVLTLLVLGIFIPHSKSIIFPVDYSSLDNNCINGFCLQSSNSTCGPASAVTILNHFCIATQEREIAKECYSYIGGTEVWYIARALRKRNIDFRFVIYNEPNYELPYPCIAGINIGAGHFITIVSNDEDSYIVGDPLVGRKKIKKEEIFKRIKFTGFFLIIDTKT